MTVKRSIDYGNASCIIGGKDFSVTGVFDATTLSIGSGGTNEVQTVTITGTPTGGTFTLAFRGQTTAAIAYNATNDAVETALEALSTIGNGNVRVTGGPGPGTAWVVNFINNDGHFNVVMMTAASSLTGGTSPAIAVTETTPGSSTGYDFRVLVGSFAYPGTIVVKETNPRGDGLDKIAEYKGSGTIYGLVDGVEEFLGNTFECDRSMPVYGKQAGLVVDARKIKNYSTYKSAIDAWAATAGVSVRHG